MLQLSGDIHEGGGQILRTALALSARTGQPFQMKRIRAGRSRPGLQAQHLAAVRLAQQVGDARVEGAERGSQDLTFVPRGRGRGPFEVDIGTAGSMTLLLQCCFWALAALPEASEVRLRGGSDVSWSPPFDYLQQVTLPLYQRLAGLETLDLRRGFFPKGGGRWRFRVQPRPAGPALELGMSQTWGPIQGRLVYTRGLASRDFLERARRAADQVDWQAEVAEAPGEGVVVVLWCASQGCPELRLGASALSEKGKSLEAMVGEALADLQRRRQVPEPVEEHLTDQILPLLALLGGHFVSQEVTPHTLANLEVIQAFLGPVIHRQGNLFRGDPRARP